MMVSNPDDDTYMMFMSAVFPDCQHTYSCITVICKIPDTATLTISGYIRYLKILKFIRWGHIETWMIILVEDVDVSSDKTK